MRALHSSSVKGPRAAHTGVSLLFVLVALLVIGVIAVVAIPKYFDRHEVTLDNACRLLSRDLRSLQNRAALDKRVVRVAFDSDGWRALSSSGQPIGGVGETHPLHRRFAGEGVFVGVTIDKIELGDDQSLSIDARGLVSEHGQIELSFRGERRRLRIHRGSGEIGVDVLPQ